MRFAAGLGLAELAVVARAEDSQAVRRRAKLVESRDLVLHVLDDFAVELDERAARRAYQVVMVGVLEVVWLMVLARVSGWKDESHKLPGLGIVLSALILVLLKVH